MKNLKNLRGAKAINRKEQKLIKGGYLPIDPEFPHKLGGYVTCSDEKPCSGGGSCYRPFEGAPEGWCVA